MKSNTPKQAIKETSKQAKPTIKKNIQNNDLKINRRNDGLFILSGLLSAVLIVMLISLTVFYLTINNDEKFKFFGIDENKKFSQLVSFDKPNHKTAVVSNWVANALVSTFDFNYKNMSTHLEDEANIWFTPAGKEALIESIQSNSGYFADVIKKEALVQLTLRQSPIFVQGRVNPSTRRYEWIFQVPALFTYTMAGQEPEVVTALFTLSVERISYNKNTLGLGLNRLLISQ